MGTTMCSLSVKEVAQYYVNMKSDVYACFLDATKAFDRVRFDCLFLALLKRRVKYPDLRLLLDLYNRQQVRTSWGASSSEYFSSANGIRQGGIISPILFCIYLDALIELFFVWLLQHLLVAIPSNVSMQLTTHPYVQ